MDLTMSLYKTTVIGVLITAVGKTTVINNVLNPTGNPTIAKAVSKNTEPLNRVHIKPIIPKDTVLLLYFPNNLTRPNTKKAVNILSTKLATCPPGKAVVMAVIIPASKPVRIVFLTVGFNKMHTKVIPNIISPFMLPILIGIKFLKIKPIARSKAVTKFFLKSIFLSIFETSIIFYSYYILY